MAIYQNKVIIVITVLLFSAKVSAQDTTSNQKVITGNTKIEHIENNSAHNWFSKNYSEYRYDTASVNALKNIPPEYKIVVVGGTWCPDTHLELPRFYKVIDDAGFSRENVKVFFVDREMKSPDMANNKYRIKEVPTFIVYRGEKEKGRIIEHPLHSFEKDLLKIIK